MRTGRRHAVAAVVAVVGVPLLVAAVRGTSEQAQPPARVGDAAGRTDGDVPGLRAAVPRPADGPSGATPTDGDEPDPVAVGDPLPPQWPEFRPTRVVLRPEAGGGAAPVDPVGVVAGSLELPDDADRVGWWRGGSRAGTPFGTVVVAGHLDSATDPSGFLAGLAA